MITLYQQLLRPAFTLCLFFMFALTAHGFTGYPSLDVNVTCSGNGLAVAPAFTARYSFSKTDIELGANFQLNEYRFTGIQGNICRYVIAPSRKVRLGFFAGLRYFYSASLRDRVVATERWKQPESTVNFDELRIRCLETQAGFGIRCQHSWKFSSFYGIALGAYHTLGEKQLYSGMHRPVGLVELSLSFGVSYSIR